MIFGYLGPLGHVLGTLGEVYPKNGKYKRTMLSSNSDTPNKYYEGSC